MNRYRKPAISGHREENRFERGRLFVTIIVTVLFLSNFSASGETTLGDWQRQKDAQKLEIAENGDLWGFLGALSCSNEKGPAASTR
ncbi:MAG TPA: hypothetical protein VKD65_01795 [Candidatus Angelobacter sp.]|nr:hypothetical protein [Candidatus Angelobacter sp.]